MTPRRRRSSFSIALIVLVGILGGVLPGADAPRRAVAEEEAVPPPAPAAIDEAIENGVDWLVREQKGDGGFGGGSKEFGHAALAAFTLLHCGLREDGETRLDKRLARVLQLIDKTGPARPRSDNEADTYETALLLLLLRDRDRAEDRARMQRCADVLARLQSANGQWGYGGRLAGRPPSGGDNSNTQFACLALGAAIGEGLTVPPATLERAWRWWRGAVQDDGGFGYSSGGSLSSASTGSMTAAGIASLSLLEAALTGQEVVAHAEPPTVLLLDKAIQRLVEGFRVDRNFGPTRGEAGQRQRNGGNGWNHYFLWSVERAMVLAGLEQLGGRDWYDEGAHHLLETQRPDGSWRGEHPLYATSFALLFLTRAADPPRAFTPPSGRVTPSAGEFENPELAEPLPPGTAADWVREPLAPRVLGQRCLRAGPESLLPLARALDDPDEGVRQRAAEALRELLSDAIVGRADRHPLARGRLLLWIRRHAEYLVPTTHGFVLP